MVEQRENPIIVATTTQGAHTQLEDKENQDVQMVQTP
jgi:hypothetical protein